MTRRPKVAKALAECCEITCTYATGPFRDAILAGALNDYPGDTADLLLMLLDDNEKGISNPYPLFTEWLNTRGPEVLEVLKNHDQKT